MRTLSAWIRKGQFVHNCEGQSHWGKQHFTKICINTKQNSYSSEKSHYKFVIGYLNAKLGVKADIGSRTKYIGNFWPWYYH